MNKYLPGEIVAHLERQCASVLGLICANGSLHLLLGLRVLLLLTGTGYDLRGGICWYVFLGGRGMGIRFEVGYLIHFVLGSHFVDACALYTGYGAAATASQSWEADATRGRGWRSALITGVILERRVTTVLQQFETVPLLLHEADGGFQGLKAVHLLPDIQQGGIGGGGCRGRVTWRGDLHSSPAATVFPRHLVHLEQRASVEGALRVGVHGVRELERAGAAAGWRTSVDRLRLATDERARVALLLRRLLADPAARVALVEVAVAEIALPPEGQRTEIFVGHFGYRVFASR